MTNTVNRPSQIMFLNSKGEKVDPKSRETPIDDSIGNNPDNAIDFIDDTGERITLSKKVFMGIMNSVYKLDTSISKEDFVNAIDSEGTLKDGLAHPIEKGELLAYMNEHDDVSTPNNNSDSAFSSLQAVGVKLTKEEILELIKKKLEEKRINLQSLQDNINIDTKTLFEYQTNIQENTQDKKTLLQQLLEKNKGQN